jgi:predicted nucleic acid-binding protein
MEGGEAARSVAAGHYQGQARFASYHRGTAVIIYLDTSAMIKLYVPEAGSAGVKQLVDDADFAAISLIAYIETKAALARKRREQTITLKDYRTVVQDFDQDWENFFVVGVSENLVRRAGSLAEKHALRVYDAVHLASAVIVREESNQPVSFVCFDDRLSRAARREGLAIP